MSQAFNPYREWLGIAAHGESPTYYELLGLRPLEADATKVEPAYQRQAAKLAGYLSGGQADMAQRLMGELAEARITLMTPTAKRAYDSALAGAVQAAGQKASAQAAATPAAQTTSSVQPTPVPVQPLAAQPLPAHPLPAQGAAAPIYNQPQPAQPGYAPQTPAHAGPMAAYPAAAAYPGAQAYSGWPGQPGMPVNPAAAAGPGYYAAPAAAYPSATEPVVPSTPVPEIRPRRSVRRRSSAVPALASIVVAAAIVGGLWIYFQKSESVAVGKPDTNGAAPSHPVQNTDREPTTGREANRSGTSGTKEPKRTNDAGKSSVRSAPSEVTKPKSSFSPPVVVPAPVVTTDTPKPDSDMPDEDMPANDKAVSDKPDMDKPDGEKPEMVSDKPSPDKPSADEPEKPEPETPKDEPMPEPKASPEEAATVAGLLKSARAALANREISKAQDLLAEATIEATAPDTTAEVSQVETLASYVEMFWDAVRKTLPKIELEEIEVKGTMLAVVEADENHLIVRAEGKNHEYKWQKIPHDLAYYLANRWLAPDDPVRNLVLGAFEIVDPKGDRAHAESLLDAAAAAKLKTDPLKEELKSSR